MQYKRMEVCVWAPRYTLRNPLFIVPLFFFGMHTLHCVNTQVPTIHTLRYWKIEKLGLSQWIYFKEILNFITLEKDFSSRYHCCKVGKYLNFMYFLFILFILFISTCFEDNKVLFSHVFTYNGLYKPWTTDINFIH